MGINKMRINLQIVKMSYCCCFQMKVTNMLTRVSVHFEPPLNCYHLPKPNGFLQYTYLAEILLKTAVKLLRLRAKRTSDARFRSCCASGLLSGVLWFRNWQKSTIFEGQELKLQKSTGNPRRPLGTKTTEMYNLWSNDWMKVIRKSGTKITEKNS